MIQLQKIIRRNYQVQITFQDDDGEKFVIGGEVNLLQSFEVFRKYCFLHHGFWPRHHCEDAATDREAVKAWNDDVEYAVAAGRED